MKKKHDYIQIRVYDVNRPFNSAWGWLHHLSMRSLKAGEEVLIWNRVDNLIKEPDIDFGDGTSEKDISTEVTHAYKDPGIYTVELKGSGPDKKWVNVKMKIKIDPHEMNGLMLKVVAICPDKVLYFDHIQIIPKSIQWD